MVTEAFQDRGPTVAALVDDLRATHAQAELVDEEAGAVVGHVMLSRSWVDARRALVDVLVLSPLSVLPEQQGRGVGTALVAAAIEAARGLRAPVLFLEGSPAYYGRRGFEPADAAGVHPAVAADPGAGVPGRVLEGHEEWMTGALVYCEPFWAHDCVGLRDPVLARIEHMFES